MIDSKPYVFTSFKKSFDQRIIGKIFLEKQVKLQKKFTSMELGLESLSNPSWRKISKPRRASEEIDLVEQQIIEPLIPTQSHTI